MSDMDKLIIQETLIFISGPICLRPTDVGQTADYAGKEEREYQCT
jgi:hypothetical protein